MKRQCLPHNSADVPLKLDSATISGNLAGMALITPENAREMAAKANAAIAARKEAMRVAVDIAVHNPVIDFAQRTLARVRLQMESIADEVDKAIRGDSKRLKELTDAYSRLADQERILAGRPMPGSLKPTSGRQRDARPSYATPQPEPETPQPVVPCVPLPVPPLPDGTPPVQ